MILDGRRVAQKVLGEVQAGVERLRAEVGVTPMLAVVLVGDFAPSKIYVANKKKAAATLGGAKLEGAEAVVIGRSCLVGKPLAQLLLARHATVTTCHTSTRDLAAHARRADVLCVAAGRPHMITGDMVREGAWVIDVGINRLATGQLVGDVDFDAASKRAHAITPVPGGVGPMTIAMLLKNTLGAAQRQVLGGELRPPQSSPGGGAGKARGRAHDR